MTRRATLLILAFLAWAGAAQAAGGQGQFTVKAKVVAGCALVGGSIDFGSYVSNQDEHRDAVGRIDYQNCRGNILFELDGGGSGSVTARKMTSDDGELAYQLYRNSSRSSVWGVGERARVLRLGGTRTGRVEVFGRIPGGQPAPPGSYGDTVRVTLLF